MSQKNPLFRAILTFRGVEPHELRYLRSLLIRSKTIESQSLYLAYPDTKLLFTSSELKTNIDALEVLIKESFTATALRELKKLE
jgi:hypothetical protein